jgi:hypothetical protein
MTLPANLTPTEQQVVADIHAGRVANLSNGMPAVASSALPEVRAAVVAALCVPGTPIAYRRVVIRGARITGQLELEEQDLACSLHVMKSLFDAEIVLTSATCRTLCFDGSQVPGVQADWITARGHVLLRDGFESTGEVKLLGASISATLNCRGARIPLNPTGRALTAGSMKATAVLLTRVEAFGSVAFPAADIASNFDADGAVFHAPGGVALNLERIKTGGYVFIRAQKDHRAVIEGTLRLYRAEIGANVQLNGTLIVAVGSSAIEATGLNAKGAVFLRDGFEAFGETRLESASIGTGLDCSGGRLWNPDGEALAAPGVSIGQSVRLTTAPVRRGGAICRVAGQLNLERGTVGNDVVANGIDLSNPAQTALTLRAAGIKGDVYIRDATVLGEVQLLGTKVGGRVNFVGTTIDNPDGACIAASGLETGGSVWFGERDIRPERRFMGRGSVVLGRADIGADLYCHGARFDGRPSRWRAGAESPMACRLWGASVKGDVYFVDGFEAFGELRLMDARIGGSLVLDGGTLTNPGGSALDAERAHIGGAVTMRPKDGPGRDPSVVWLFRTVGSISFRAASMLALECHRATIRHPEWALIADRVSISLGFEVRQSLVAGRVTLFGATIGNVQCDQTVFSSSHFQAFDATAATISGSLVIRESQWAGGVKLLGARIGGAFELGQSSFAEGLNLRQAHAGILSDDMTSWPRRRLFLAGFAYDLLGSSAVTRAPSRIAWLRNEGDGEHHPEIYEQLVRVLRQMGHDREAREVAIARRDASLNRGARRIWRLPLKVLIGHGYKPWRTVWALSFMIAFGWGVFEYAGRHALMTTQPGANPGIANVFEFQPLVYSIDELLPVVDLQQEKYWFPDVRKKPLGAAVRVYLWAHVAIGWVLVTLLLGAMSGLIKRE